MAYTMTKDEIAAGMRISVGATLARNGVTTAPTDAVVDGVLDVLASAGCFSGGTAELGGEHAASA